MSSKSSNESTDEDTIKKLTELRAYLEKRINRLESEADRMKTLVWLLGEFVAERSFRRAEIPQAAKVEYKQTTPLKTRLGAPLATMYVNDDVVRVVPEADKKFTVSTPPFQVFLITKVLDMMRGKDIEDSKRGEVEPDKILSYNVVQDGDVIKELIIQNYRDEDRLRKIRTTVRWTFEKMYEKLTGEQA